jgi:hypothetical protein
MNDTISLSFTFKTKRGRNGKARVPQIPADLPKGTVPRISKLMALAHHFEHLRRRKVVTDYADLARLGGVTRARMTQIMSLLNLAPDIHEEILFLPRTLKGHDPITTKKVLPIARILPWPSQRRAWEKLKKQNGL